MRRSRKPFVTPKKGRLYYRITWMEDGRRRERFLPLPGEENSAEFDREYWAIRSGRSEQLVAAPSTSWNALVKSFRASSDYRRLAAGTRSKYEDVLRQLLEKNGDKDIRKTTRQQVRTIHEKYAETPRKADHYLQTIRRILNFAKNELEWIQVNPAEGIKLFGTQKEFEPWPEAAQEAYKRAARALEDEIALTAFYLGIGTGQRPGDVRSMKWEHYDGAYMAVVQDKTDERLWVYCPDFLRNHLDALTRRGAHILAQNLTQPLSYDALSKRFRKVREAAGPVAAGLVMHGWRKTAAVALAEAGCSDAEIQAVTGHRTAAMAAAYRRKAAQKKLSRQAQERRGTNKG